MLAVMTGYIYILDVDAGAWARIGIELLGHDELCCAWESSPYRAEEC